MWPPTGAPCGQDRHGDYSGEGKWGPSSLLSPAVLGSNSSSAPKCLGSGKSPAASASSSKKQGHSTPSTCQLHSDGHTTGISNSTELLLSRSSG